MMINKPFEIKFKPAIDIMEPILDDSSPYFPFSRLKKIIEKTICLHLIVFW